MKNDRNSSKEFQPVNNPIMEKKKKKKKKKMMMKYVCD
jgi:hypothetical protein